jgi:glycosyltransferase involved in cell wall biosynthesis
MADSTPLVSCIMPIRDRPHLVAQAMRCFQRQDHEARELVIVDDGDCPLGTVDDRVRVIRPDRPGTAGHKRNVACAASRGEFIAHWEPDDWHSSRRLRVQLHALRQSGRDLVGSPALLHYSPVAGGVWLHRRPQPHRPGLAGGTLLYRASLWRRYPFPDLDSRVDDAFLDQVPAGRLLALADTSLSVTVIHAGNAGRHAVHDPRYEPCGPEGITELLAADWNFCTSLRHGGMRSVASRPVSDAVNFSAHFMVADGYGSMAEYIALGMDRSGARVNVLPYRIVEAGLSPRLIELIAGSRLDPAAPLLHHSTVDAGTHLFARCPQYVLSTMWESDSLPVSWLPALHRARAVVVPTRWCADVFRAHSISSPIHVVPDGVDPEVYHYRPTPDRDGLTTLMVGTNLGRKHLAEGIAAWRVAFAGNPDARLLLKAHHQFARLAPDDPRISYVDVNEPTRGIAHWYRRADVLMALGNEGSGLPLIEAMACGLPVVALDAEGQHDVCAEVPDLVLPVPGDGYEPHVAGVYGRCGRRTVPSVAAVVQGLRWIAGHRGEARAMGQAAAAWVRAKRDVWDKGPALLDILERSIQPPRSLRATTARRA